MTAGRVRARRAVAAGFPLATSEHGSRLVAMKPLPMIMCGILAAALALLAAPAEGARKGKRMDDQTTPSALREQKFTKRVSRTIELKYLLYLPEGYEP